MKNGVRTIFSSIIMPHNLIYFRKKMGFKCVFVYLASLSGHFRTAFGENNNRIFLLNIKININ